MLIRKSAQIGLENQLIRRRSKVSSSYLLICCRKPESIKIEILGLQSTLVRFKIHTFLLEDPFKRFNLIKLLDVWELRSRQNVFQKVTDQLREIHRRAARKVRQPLQQMWEDFTSATDQQQTEQTFFLQTLEFIYGNLMPFNWSS